jgi:pyrroline-5-carboxylate reductase
MRLGFIGTGVMGTAMIKGYLAVHTGEEKNIYAYDKDTDKLKALAGKLGITGCESLEKLMEQSDVIVLAVKPFMFEMVVPEVSAFYRSGQVLVSIAAGISISYIEKLMDKDSVKIVRVMPNTPAMVNAGMSALCRNQFVIFKSDGSNRITHTGIYLKDGEFINASSSDGKVKISTLTGYYDRNFVRARRVSLK